MSGRGPRRMELRCERGHGPAWAVVPRMMMMMYAG